MSFWLQPLKLSPMHLATMASGSLLGAFGVHSFAASLSMKKASAEDRLPEFTFALPLPTPFSLGRGPMPVTRLLACCRLAAKTIRAKMAAVDDNEM